MGLDPRTELLYVIDVIRGRWSPAGVENKIKATARWDGEETRIRIPQDPGQAGKFQANYLVGQLRGYSVSTEREEGDKANRADPFAAQCEHGFVKMVEGDWNNSFVDELCAFPNGVHDDQVDAASAALRALVRRISWHAA
jgi:predicted phage terminase large subunit-like protein